AHAAVHIGLINKIIPSLKDKDGNYISNPFVSTDIADDWGNPAFGAFKTGEAKAAAKAIAAECTSDLSLLDEETNMMAYRLALTMPDCLSKTLESLRKKKLEHWLQNCETNRSWLALNMMTEAKAGFKAFNDGPKHNREVDFLGLRRALSEARPWDESLFEEIRPK
ncbi:MAG: 6-oxocyclohex-1-ene-1-carbonyl-CoA hydratase, partial [Gammaproteobacteria bacterium]|nr:6-oxocyclohex-1-ene-1-carbonyl-CoA hydratase [Gammaproteobacteria bacterium]